MSGVLKLGSTTFGTENNGKIELTNVQFSSSHHTWELKAVDAPIVGANYSTNDDPLSGQLAIYNGATKLWGITEDGWVQNPNLIGFQAGFSSGNISTGSSGVIIIYNEVITASIHYNNTTGRFTAPITGKYFFITSNLNIETATRLQTALYVNGVVKSVVESSGAGGYQQSSNIGIFDLSAGDYVEVFLQAYSAIYGNDGEFSQFAGYLIG